MFRTVPMSIPLSLSLSLWRCGRTRAMACSFLRFLDHTQLCITFGRTPLDEWSARRRDLYLKKHNTHNKQASMPPVGFEPTISAGERPQTHVLDRAATGTGFYVHHQEFFSLCTQQWCMSYRFADSLRAGSGWNVARKLSTNLYDIYNCCVYSEKLLMMDRGTVRNM